MYCIYFALLGEAEYENEFAFAILVHFPGLCTVLCVVYVVLVWGKVDYEAISEVYKVYTVQCRQM